MEKNKFILKTAYKKLLILISIVMTLVIVLIFSFRSLLSYSLIEKNLSEFLGIKIKLENPKTVISSNFDINFKVNNLKISDKSLSKNYVVVEELIVILKPFSILVNKANFKKLDAKKVSVNLKRTKDGKIDLIQELNLENIKKLKKHEVNFTRLVSNINNIDLTFIDEYKIHSITKVNLINSEISLSKKQNGLNIKEKGNIELTLNDKKEVSNIFLDISSDFPLNKLSSKDLNIDFKLDNFNLYLLSPIIGNSISKDISILKGNANARIITTEDKKQDLMIDVEKLKFILKDNKVVYPFEKVIIGSLFDLDSDKLNIENLTLLSKDLDVKINGIVKKPFELHKKNPDINLKVAINNTQLNNLLYFIPDNAMFYRPKGIPKLKEANFHSVLNGQLNVEFAPVNITGNLKALNVHIPNYPKPYRRNDVNAIFMKDKVRIYTRVYTPQNEYVVVDGVSNLDNSLYGQYSVKSTKKIDLAFAQLYLVPIQQIIGFNIGPVPIMDITGYGNIDIKTKGTLKDAQIFGEFNAYNATARIDGLNAKLTDGDCKLVFNNRILHFKQIKGKLDNGNFLLTGQGNTKGQVKLNAKVNNIRTNKAIKIFKESLISKSYTKIIKNIAGASGFLDADINLNGKIDDYENKEFFEKLALSGAIKLKNNKIILNNHLTANKLNGNLNFGEKQTADFNFNLNKSKVNLLIESNDSLSRISLTDNINFISTIKSDDFIASDLVSEIVNSNFVNKKNKKLFKPFEELNVHSKFLIKTIGSVNINNINLTNTKNNGYIIGLNSAEYPAVKFNSGMIKLLNNKLIFDNFNMNYQKGKIALKGNIDRILSKQPFGNLNIDLENLNLDFLNGFIPNIKLQDVYLKTANLVFRGDDIKVNSLSLDYHSMPMFLTAQLKEVFTKKSLVANFSTILDEITADLIINPHLVSPLKVKGEIPCTGSFYGQNENYSINLKTKIPKNSDLSFQGSNLGDLNYDREINSKIDVNNNLISIRDLKYIKYITNQNNKVNPIVNLKANGQIQAQGNDDYLFKNLKVATNSPINVRIINSIFKKSLLKKGNFECNITLNGNTKEPKVNGNVELQDLDIPLYNTQINNIKINIDNSFINGEIFANNQESDLKIIFKMINDLKPPYVINKILISSNKLNIAQIFDGITIKPSKTDISSKPEITLKSDDVEIKNGTLDIKEVTYDKIEAQNLQGEFSYKDNNLNFKDVQSNISQGTFETNGTYNIKTTQVGLDAKIKNCDANNLAKSFLGLSGQIYGKMDGKIDLSAKNINTPENIKNLKSKVSFSINNGKMPKLGSLEYLLRAGNLFKNGIMGLSLNNLIQVLTPYKTGEFEKITGNLEIDDGSIENLEILTQGKNLSLFLSGGYNILENNADITIYGKLSQTISNALGALGNASINQFLNSLGAKKQEERLPEFQEKFDKIPPIENDGEDLRFFLVKVSGDINKENYIKSFSWK